jgi:hypothetical protein
VAGAARGWKRLPEVAFAGEGGANLGAVVLASLDGNSARLRVRRFEAATGQFVDADIAVPLPPLDTLESSAAMSASYEFLRLSEDGRLAGVSRRVVSSEWTPNGPPTGVPAPTSRQLASAKSRGTRLDVVWFDLQTGRALSSRRQSFAPRECEPRASSFCDGREWTLELRHSWRAHAAGPPRLPPPPPKPTGESDSDAPLGCPIEFDPRPDLEVWVQLVTTERRRVRGGALLWRRVQVAPDYSKRPRSQVWRDSGRDSWGIAPAAEPPAAPVDTPARLVLREALSGRTRTLEIPRAQAVPEAPIGDTGDPGASSEAARFVWSRLAFSRDGNFLAALGRSAGDCFVFVWNWKSGRLEWRRDIPRFDGERLAFSPDGGALAVSGADWRMVPFPFMEPGRLLVFDVRDGGLRFDMEPRTPEQQRAAPRQVLAARLREARARALNQDPTGAGFLPGDPGVPYRVVWSPDSRSIATRHADGSLQLWHVPAR